MDLEKFSQTSETEVPKLAVPKIKRFATHSEAFTYYLVLLNINTYIGDGGSPSNSRAVPGHKERATLIEILEESLSRLKWIEVSKNKYEVVEEGMVLPADKPIIFRTKFTNAEFRESLTWDFIHYLVILDINNKSFLSNNKKTFIGRIFQWVSNFVAKEGEEVNMTLEDVSKITSPEEVKERAQSVLSHVQDVNSKISKEENNEETTETQGSSN